MDGIDWESEFDDWKNGGLWRNGASDLDCARWGIWFAEKSLRPSVIDAIECRATLEALLYSMREVVSEYISARHHETSMTLPEVLDLPEVADAKAAIEKAEKFLHRKQQ